MAVILALVCWAVIAKGLLAIWTGEVQFAARAFGLLAAACLGLIFTPAAVTGRVPRMIFERI